MTVFKILYPDDPSPGLIAALEAAMERNLTNVQAQLAMLRGQVNSNTWAEANQLCRAWAATATFYDVDTFLREQPPGRTPLDKLRTDPLSAGVMLMPGDFTGATNGPVHLRVPWLPCIQNALAGSDGLHRLLEPYLGNPVLAVQEIEFGWQHHPEATIPLLGGMLLENQQLPSGPPSTAILRSQARLYQMAADSPAMMPQMGRLARYLAARTEFELATRSATNALSATTNCLANLRQAAASPETSVEEGHAYFQFALGLGDNDLALQLVSRLESQSPDDPATRRDRIQVELAMGAFGSALVKLDQLLDDQPDDPWALAQRRIARSRLKTLIDSTSKSVPSNP